MQAPPQISPDGQYWWDGQTWQPKPSASAPPAEPPAADSDRPSWLAEGVVIPGPPPAAPPPNHAAFVAVEQVAPLWAPAPPRRHIITTVALWAGVILGGASILFGLLGIVVAQGVPASRQQTEYMGVLVFLVIGAAIFFPAFLNLTGYAQILMASSGIFGALFSELGVVGSLIVLLMIANTIIAVGTHAGGGRYGIPLATIAIVVRRVWQGKWAGAGIIAATWAVGIVITMVAG